MKIAIFIIILTLLNGQLYAQGSNETEKSKTKVGFLEEERKWSVELPIWIPGFRGEFAYGEAGIEGEDGTTPIPDHPIDNPGFGDVFKRLFRTRFDLNYFLVLGVSYDDERLYGEMDAFTGTLGSSIIFRTINYKLVRASVHADLVHIRLGYNLYERTIQSNKGKYQLYGIAGTRLHNFYIKAGNSDIQEYLAISPLWIEPILGGRNEILYKNWKFILQGDIGSFWINDKFSYQFNLHAYYRASNLVSLKIGWNSWYINYRDIFRKEDLLIKTHLAGPIASVSFHF
ncbi:hypothetical protein [Draconibacterium sp. IB214405]|uniref:hypothetical protein n=1 Tax=Draconibacterium sp. IB214405 TaxID=3097352 RepID=UPI002A23C9FE|nr:hypothetical protein [Draconibacterium sp. IB214405]